MKEITYMQKEETGRCIEIVELSLPLGMMPNGRSPGSDGFPADFFSILFWWF